MPKLQRISGKKLVSVLEKMGFEQVRQKGSHVVLKRETATETIGCVVPLHKELAVGTIRGVLRQAGVSLEEYAEYV